MILCIGIYQLACHQSKMFWSPVNDLIKKRLFKKVFLIFFYLGQVIWAMASLTLVPRAILRGVAELHVAPGMTQWRMFVTSCYF